METNKSNISAGSTTSAKNILFSCENLPPTSRYFSARDRKQLSKRELASKLHADDMRVGREKQMFIYYHLSIRHCPHVEHFVEKKKIIID